MYEYAMKELRHAYNLYKLCSNSKENRLVYIGVMKGLIRLMNDNNLITKNHVEKLWIFTNKLFVETCDITD